MLLSVKTFDVLYRCVVRNIRNANVHPAHLENSRGDVYRNSSPKKEKVVCKYAILVHC